MSAFEQLTQALATTIDKTAQARGHLQVALGALEDGGATLMEVLRGTHDPDAEQLMHEHPAINAALRTVCQQLSEVTRRVEAYQVHIGAGKDVAAQSVVSPSTSKIGSSSPVENEHGDRYPVDSAGLVEMLPRRVVPGTGQRTVGVARLGEKVLPPIESGRDRVWSERVRTRLADLGEESTWLDSHVELKLVAMMIDTKRKSAEVAINQTPCGYERQRAFPDTCHRILEEFLPPGYSLTVYGTKQDNTPFQHTYEGREQS